MKSQAVRDEILLLMDQCAATEAKIVQTYYKRRTLEMDKEWVKLQAGKELTAAMSVKVPEILRMFALLEREVDREKLRTEVHEAWEEVNHYCDYVGVLQFLLGDEPIPIDEIRRYNVRTLDRQWPEHSRRMANVSLIRGLASDWVRAVLYASGEGGAAAFHWAVSQLPPDDEFLRRVAAVGRRVTEDEIHHGPEEIARLAEEVPSENEFELAKRDIIQIQLLNMRERNEQFTGVLNEEELADVERRLEDRTIEPVRLFRDLAKAAA